MIRLLKSASRATVAALLLLVMFLMSCQSKMMYFPRPYDPAALSHLEIMKGRRLEYTTSQGPQVAFYLPPRAAGVSKPAYLWLVCGGNGSLALDYIDQPQTWDARFGYLFVDYPGYGLCSGSPNPHRIEENTVAAAEKLRKDLGWSEEEFRERTGVFGHSIGCAASLMAADKMKLQSAVLCAPFTSMTDMGRRVLGWPLCYLNMHRFDNVARLRTLEERGASVRMFHGTDDEVIPVEMSRKMQKLFPRMVRLTEVERGRHNDVVDLARQGTAEAMRELSGVR
jgi:pimeloyl-ACP methyl ester carboxylesterase